MMKIGGKGKQLDQSHILNGVGGVLDAKSREFLDSVNAAKKPFFLYFAPQELYKLANDPMERNNLLDVPAHKSVVDFLLRHARQSAGDQGSSRLLQPHHR